MVFLSAGSADCAGAARARSTQGGRVNAGRVAITLPQPGSYKVCHSALPAPTTDAHFAFLSNVILDSAFGVATAVATCAIECHLRRGQGSHHRRLHRRRTRAPPHRPHWSRVLATQASACGASHRASRRHEGASQARRDWHGTTPSARHCRAPGVSQGHQGGRGHDGVGVAGEGDREGWRVRVLIVCGAQVASAMGGGGGSDGHIEV